MLKYHNFDIVFQEIPDETTLAINITGCPYKCPGCHSPHLREDTGEPLTQEALLSILERYGEDITCICIMGGDARPLEVQALAGWIKRDLHLRSAWYSGSETLLPGVDVLNFDYIKIGPYIEAAGGLKSPATNQRLYRVGEDGRLADITSLFQKQNKPLG